MFAGLPGTGLGGLFYALLVLLMPLRELWLRGRHGRWGFIARQWALLAGILAGLTLEAWALAWLLQPESGAGALAEEARLMHDHVVPALALMPFILLALIHLGIHALRLALRARRRSEPAGLYLNDRAALDEPSR